MIVLGKNLQTWEEYMRNNEEQWRILKNVLRGVKKSKENENG